MGLKIKKFLANIQSDKERVSAEYRGSSTKKNIKYNFYQVIKKQKFYILFSKLKKKLKFRNDSDQATLNYYKKFSLGNNFFFNFK